MPNYQNSKIYAIRSHQTDDIYIGSTTQSLSMRMVGHRKHYKLWKNGKFRYITSFEILKHGDAYIELIEARPCKNKDDLRVLEGGYIRNRHCVNKYVAGRSKKEWRIDNKERLAKWGTQYCNANKEKKSKYDAQYRIDNKDKLRRQKNLKTDCPCGGRYSNSNKSKHLRSKKHQTYIASTDTTNNI